MKKLNAKNILYSGSAKIAIIAFLIIFVLSFLSDLYFYFNNKVKITQLFEDLAKIGFFFLLFKLNAKDSSLLNSFFRRKSGILLFLVIFIAYVIYRFF